MNTSTKRTKRIQTVISPEHHELLSELTKTHGKMNHIIEQGIELVYQSKTGLHSCNASKTLNIQEQMIQNGYIFFDRDFIEQLFLHISNGTILEWIKEYMDSNLEAANPLLTIIETANTYQGLLEYLQLESDYFKLYNVKFYDVDEFSITLQPLLFHKYPEITATILCRTLDFLKFNFNIEILSNQILIYHVDAKKVINNTVRNKAIRKRYKKMWSQISPTGYYRYKLKYENELDIQSHQDFQTNLLQILTNYKIYNWRYGSINVNETKSILFTQKSLIKLLNPLKNESAKSEILKEIGESFFELMSSKISSVESINTFLNILGDNWSVLGYGKLFQLTDESREINPIKLENNFLETPWILEILNPSLQLCNVMIDSTDLDNTFQETLTLNLLELNKKLLIVDDEQDVIDALYREIRKINKNIYIHSTTDPLKVKGILEKELFDFIIIDHKMKKMTGIAVLELLKDLYPKMKRILITGYGDTQIMKEAINKANINYFINKPWKKEDIENAIGN